MTVVVSATVRPPPHPFYGDTWERGLDPFHPDAFRGFPDEIVDQVRSINPGSRSGGWFLLDGYGQEIGFVSDGTVLEIN